MHTSETQALPETAGSSGLAALSAQSATTETVAGMARKEDFAHKASVRATVLALWLLALTLAVVAMLMP